MIKNAVGRELPKTIGTYHVRPFAGISGQENPNEIQITSKRKLYRKQNPGGKVLANLRTAIEASGLADGMTISFHHSFREGDQVIGQVLETIRQMGIKDLKFAPSAVVNIKNTSIADYVKDGTITAIEGSGIRGELGNGILNGILSKPVILRPHGGRPRAIEAGELSIDVAFIGASAADACGNCTGITGPNACGSLGYSLIDAQSAGCVVVVTDHLVEYPCLPISISQDYVDYVVAVDSIGDPNLIGAGAARITKNPRDLLIAKRTAQVIAASRRFRNGFVFQTGAGAISIACTSYLAEEMMKREVHASMALGGIGAGIVKMYQKGLVRAVACSQSFDMEAARAIGTESGIIEIDNSLYSNPYRKGCMLDCEDFGILAALEIDVDFHVNILTGCNGQMIGGLGGGPDVAGSAQIPIVVLPIVRGRIPCVVKRVFTCCTPGETVALVVTEAGIALNPKHRNYRELKEDFHQAGIGTVTIEELQRRAEQLTGIPKPVACEDEIACIVEYRDGTVIDVIRKIKRRFVSSSNQADLHIF